MNDGVIYITEGSNNMDDACYKCEAELDPDTSYEVIDAWDKSIGSLCEPCAEADFDSYMESRVF